MEVKTAVERFKALQKMLHAYDHASGLLYYDSVTGAPKGITDPLGDTLAALEEESHRLFINDSIDELLSFLLANSAELDEQTRREAEESRKDFDKLKKVPKDELIAYTVLLNKAQAVWHEAKEKNDFEMFRPYLEQILETLIRFAGYYDPDKDPYDVWLNEHEEGFSRAVLDKFFTQLRGEIVPLLAAVQSSGVEIDDGFLHLDYPVDKQRELSDYLMQIMTIDRAHCGLSETEHPFTIEFNKYDVRITTHYKTDDVASSMYSVIHEGGHALYELHIGDALYGSSLAHGVSMGVHESQSRFYENLVGRSLPFITLIFPKLAELFPTQLRGVTPEKFWLAVNKAQPSLIRTEADELTYPLHVLIRYELEKRLFAGELKVAELPGEWNRLYKEYLGVDVPDDTRGVLQDSHWSGGSMGYFPSYAVGSAYGAQMLEAMKKYLDVDALVGRGELAPMIGWLTDRIYRYGSLKKPAELIRLTCGADFDPSCFTDYLKNKFSGIYKLK